MLALLGSLMMSQGVPVWDGKLAPPQSIKGGVEYCNIAVTLGRRPVVVRAGPSRSFAVLQSLESGTTVYTCNEAIDPRLGYDRYWVGVAYRGSEKPCIGATRMGLPLPLSRRCRTGWVERERINTLTG